MSSQKGFGEHGNVNKTLLSLWFQKLLYDNSFDNEKTTWIGEKFIKQLTNQEFSDVFLQFENLHLPIDQLYEMIKKEKEVLAFLSAPVDLDNLTLDEIACEDCEESNKKIEELQKIQEKQRSIIKSNDEALKYFEAYLQDDVPRLIEEATVNYDKKDVIEIDCQPKIVNKTDIQNTDIFSQSNKTLINTIHKAIDAIMTQQNLKQSQEINKLQDKIIELQTVVENYARVNDEADAKLKKYKLNCLNLKKANSKLSQLLNEHHNKPLQKVNEDLKNGKFFVELKARNDRFMKDSQELAGKEQIGDC